MTEKARSDAVLKTLPKERQEAVWEYLQTHSISDTVKWLGADGIKTSTRAVSEFRSWFNLNRRFQLFEANTLTMLELLRQKRPDLPESELQDYANDYFQLQAVEMNDPATYVQLVTARFKAEKAKQELRIKEEHLALQKAKFQRETCELFLKWAQDEAARAVATSGASHAEKIEWLGRRMFGEDWECEHGPAGGN